MKTLKTLSAIAILTGLLLCCNESDPTHTKTLDVADFTLNFAGLAVFGFGVLGFNWVLIKIKEEEKNKGQ